MIELNGAVKTFKDEGIPLNTEYYFSNALILNE